MAFPNSGERKLLALWLYEIGAFALLPLIIYVLVYLLIGEEVVQVLLLPEWLFITVLLYGSILGKLVVHFRDYAGYLPRIRRTIAQGVLGILIASVLLCVSIIAPFVTEITLGTFFYAAQFSLFTHALWQSAQVHYKVGKLEGLDEELASRERKSDEATSTDVA